MNKYSIPMLFTAILLFAGCNKPDQDYPQLCQILQLTNHSRYDFDDYTATFEYDSKGTPLRITRATTATGATNYLFRHDSHNRVSDVIGSYREGAYGDYFEFWHRLKYDAKNRVIQDSSFYTGIIDNNPAQVPGVSLLVLVYTFQYDAQNRMIKYNERQELGYQDRYFYYNKKGNLDSTVTKRDDGYQYTNEFGNYDDKVNIHRTNPLWQYLDRNYSSNNSLNTITSNKYGLPTTIGATSIKDNTPYFLTFSVDNLDIQYSCK
jgi:hypothetical protein